jgi:hypothetical protein
MIKMLRLLTYALLVICSPIYSMRAPTFHVSKSNAARRIPPVSHVRAIPRSIIRRYSDQTPHEKLQQEAWKTLNHNLIQRMERLQSKANEHRALAAQHEYYARAYEALAFLEYDKDGLLKITVRKLNSVALDPFGGPIDLEREEHILEIICKTQEEFQNGLPKDKSQQ